MKVGDKVIITKQNILAYKDEEFLKTIHTRPDGSLDNMYDNEKIAVDSVDINKPLYGVIINISPISGFPKIKWLTDEGYFACYHDVDDFKLINVQNSPGKAHHGI